MPILRWLALLLLLLPATPALAHAILLDSAPPPGGAAAPGPAELRLRFNSRIDAARSRVALTGPSGEAVLPLKDAGRPDVLLCPATLAPGAYVLHWQVLAVDGHITRGTLAFTVPGSP